MSDTGVCDFCGNSEAEARFIRRSATAAICDSCVDLCRDIIADHDEGEPVNPEIACAFCGKDRRLGLVAGPNWIYICDECVTRFWPVSG